MPNTPEAPQAIAFIDGQNLFYAAKKRFGSVYPDYDPVALSQSVCTASGYVLKRIHFYTGIPSPRDNRFWNSFWSSKLAVMGTRGVRTFTRPLRYRDQTVPLPGVEGGKTTVRVGQEKGIDVRIALDVVRFALDREYDVALIFSQDQDLSEAADDVKRIAEQQGRWIKVCSVFPDDPTSPGRGINNTQWSRLDKAGYDSCLDPNDYRPTPPGSASGS